MGFWVGYVLGVATCCLLGVALLAIVIWRDSTSHRRTHGGGGPLW